jgi:hypothetical protein
VCFDPVKAIGNGTCLLQTELSLLSSCGSCGTSCSFANAAATCSGGPPWQCQLGACNAKYGNCDNNAANGYEVSCQSALCVTHYGESREGLHACKTTNKCLHAFQVCCGLGFIINTHATATTNFLGKPPCVVVPHVKAHSTMPYVCSTSVHEPLPLRSHLHARVVCQVNLPSSVDHCGLCGNNCTAKPNVASATCSSGGCSITTCAAGYLNCDNNAATGCEVRQLLQPSRLLGQCALVPAASTAV